MPGGDPAEILERVDVALEERFLCLRGIDPVDCFPGERQPEREHVALRLDPRQHHPEFPEIDLRLRARGMLLRDEHLSASTGLGIDHWAAFRDVIPDR